MLDSYRLMSAAEAQEFVLAARAMEWKQGQARTKEATGTVKKNQEIKASDGNAARALTSRVAERVQQHNELMLDHAVKKMMIPKFNRYSPENGGEYQRHGDAAIMGGQVRTDLACTIFLSHRDTYEGGELCIEEPNGSFHSVKGDPGLCVVYPCHMPHWVTPVTSGERICAVTWMESSYRDVEQRCIMRRFMRELKKLEDMDGRKYGDIYTSLGTIHSRLQRMWADYEPPVRPN